MNCKYEVILKSCNFRSALYSKCFKQLKDHLHYNIILWMLLAASQECCWLIIMKQAHSFEYRSSLHIYWSFSTKNVFSPLVMNNIRSQFDHCPWLLVEMPSVHQRMFRIYVLNWKIEYPFYVFIWDATWLRLPFPSIQIPAFALCNFDCD